MQSIDEPSMWGSGNCTKLLPQTPSRWKSVWPTVQIQNHAGWNRSSPVQSSPISLLDQIMLSPTSDWDRLDYWPQWRYWLWTFQIPVLGFGKVSINVLQHLLNISTIFFVDVAQPSKFCGNYSVDVNPRRNALLSNH